MSHPQPGRASLYAANTPAVLWGPDARILPADLERAVAILPGGPEAVARGGWPALMEHVLGEQSFGPRRYTLSPPKRLYYACKPLLPRRLTTLVRGRYEGRQRQSFPLGWPIEDRFVRFLAALGLGRPRVWPDGAEFALVLTHDVERAAGQAFVRTLADLDARYGFRSAFNFVAADYPVDRALLAELAERGFEVGVHGLHHDHRTFVNRAEFARRAARINGYLREWRAVGFRAPSTLRNPAWMQALEMEYDSSFFDTDPFEPMPGGVMTLWPFLIGRFVELPYTLPQDHTLLVTLGERTPRLWLEKTDFIARHGGMALANVHPDYLLEPARLNVYEAFLREMAARRDGGLPGGGYWHALPRDVARWWRRRVEQAQPASAGEAGATPADSAGNDAGAAPTERSPRATEPARARPAAGARSGDGQAAASSPAHGPR